MVASSSRLALRLGIPAIFMGVTVVAFATSAPELAVSLGAAATDNAGLALGNVLGSNIANILFILGLSALITPIAIQARVIRFDIPILIVASVAGYLLALDQVLQPVDGGILLVLFAAFMGFQIMLVRRESSEKEVPASEANPASPLVQLLLLVGGLGLLVLGAHWLVESAIAIARYWGLSELVIGLTIVALGTSLPEVATSVWAAWKNEGDLSVGNVIGSNIFNLLMVLGATALFSGDGIEVSSAALALDFPLLVAISIACLPILFTGHRISRWEGGLFLGYYAAYLLYLFGDSTNHELLPLFNSVMLIFVGPITLVTLFVLAYRYYRTLQ